MELSELKGQSWENEETIAARISREDYQGGERAAERKMGVLHRLSLQSAPACIHVKKLPAIRERATERIRGSNL